jgi:hypothetical protein
MVNMADSSQRRQSTTESTGRSAEAIKRELAELNTELQQIRAKIDARLAELHAARTGADGNSHKKE